MQQANPARLQSAGWLSESGVSCEPDVFWQTTGVGRASASVADRRIIQGDSSHSEWGRCSGTSITQGWLERSRWGVNLASRFSLQNEACVSAYAQWHVSVHVADFRNKPQLHATWALVSMCLSFSENCQQWEASKKNPQPWVHHNTHFFYSALTWWYMRWRSHVTIPQRKCDINNEGVARMINCTQTVGYVKEDRVLSACPLKPACFVFSTCLAHGHAF